MGGEANTAGRARTRTWGAVACAAALAAFLAWYGAGWRVDNRVDAWANATGADPAYERLVARFGGDAAVLVRVDRFDPARPAHAAFVRALGPRLSALPGVDRAFDPLALPGSPREVDGAALRDELQAKSSSPLCAALDAVAVAPPRLDLVLAVAPTATPEQHAALAVGVEAARREAAASGLRVRAAGHPLVAAGLDVEARRVDQVFGPALVAVALIACASFLRSVPLALVTMLPGILASLALRAGLRAAGIDANMILVAGAPLVLVVHVAAVLHLTLRFLRHLAEGLGPDEAARVAARETRGAALLAAWTTAVGFGVFAASEVRAVRELGLAVGVVVATLVPLAYLVVPYALPGAVRSTAAAGGAWLAASAHRGAARVTARRWRRLAAWSARRRGPVFACAVACCVLGAMAPLGMPVSSDALDYFPDGHAVREEFLGLEAEGASLSTVDVLVPLAPGQALDMARIEVLAQRIATLERVVGTFGPGDIARELESRLGRVAGKLAEPAAQRTARRVDEAGEWARLTVRASVSDLVAVEALADEVREVVAREWHGPANGGHGQAPVVTSSVTRLTALHDALVGTLLSSLALTGGVALAAFFALLRDPRDRGAALLANVLPVALALLAVRLSGHPLDAATVMVASVVMGIAVDTTFHLLLAARGSPDGFPRQRVLLASFAKVGDAALASAVVLAAGFGALGLADFAPTARFGLASALGVITALAGDLVVVPALVLAARRRQA